MKVFSSFLCLLKILGFSLITIEFAEDQEKYLGWAEAATGLGLAIGPTLGSLVYDAVHYEWTFIIFGGVLAIGGVAIHFALPSTLNTGYVPDPKKAASISLMRSHRLNSADAVNQGAMLKPNGSIDYNRVIIIDKSANMGRKYTRVANSN